MSLISSGVHFLTLAGEAPRDEGASSLGGESHSPSESLLLSSIMVGTFATRGRVNGRGRAHVSIERQNKKKTGFGLAH